MSVTESKSKKKKIPKQIKNENPVKVKEKAAAVVPDTVSDSKVKPDSGVTKAKKRKNEDTQGKGAFKKRRKSSERAPQSKISHQAGAPDWQQVRVDAADVRARRKANHKMYEVGKHMKTLWEELRVERCAPDRRSALVRQLSGLVSGRVAQMVRAHDRARVCETLFQLGGEPTRTALFAEVKDSLAELSRDKYARHFVLKIIAYGSAEQKLAVGEALRGRVTTLMGHRFGSEVVEAYFRDAASEPARLRLLAEFYGGELVLASEQARSLAEMVAAHPERRALYLTNLRSQLQSLLDKQLLTGGLAHRLLHQYLELCSETDRADVIGSLRLAVVQMLHTKDGAAVGRLCLWWGTAKDRKAIIKSMKTLVQKVCVDEHGFSVMLALLDVVDDTRLVKKALLEEMMAHVAEIVVSEHGRKVVHHLLSPRHTTYFHPALVAELCRGDANTTSKKEPELRRRELLDAVSEPLLRTASIHCLEWVQDPSRCILLTHILTRCSAGDSLQAALRQLARRVALPVSSATDAHLVNNSAAYMQLKKLLQADRQRAADHSVLFAPLVLEELSEEATLSWLAGNRTAFLLVIMLETEVPAVTETLVSRVLPLTKKLKPACKGADILKKKLAAAARQLAETGAQE